MSMTEVEYLERRIAEAEAAMISAHDHLVEWYVQDQADVIGIASAINAAHKITPVKLMDAWLGWCPRNARPRRRTKNLKGKPNA